MKDSDLIAPQNQIAGACASRIILRNIAFAEVQARLLGSDVATHLGYRLPQVVVTWSQQGDEISAVFPFLLVVESRHEPGGPAEAIAEISVMMNLVYRLVHKGGEITPDELPHVIGTLGYMHAWPYFRADVQWLTTKLGFPALVLPVVLSGQVSDRVVIHRFSVESQSASASKGVATVKAPAALPVASSPSKDAKPTQTRRKRKAST